jgi:hypothetical protein
MRNQDFLANAAQPALDTTKNNHHAAKLKLKKRSITMQHFAYMLTICNQANACQHQRNARNS